MNIQEIKITNFPCVLFSDNHTNIKNIAAIKELYPNSQLISLGDLSFLFAKPGEKRNAESIQYFIDNKIPCLRGNHEDHIIACATGNSLYQFRVIGEVLYNEDYGLNNEQLNYLEKLPIGFKLILPNGDYYLCFHNEPRDLWNFRRQITQDEFIKIYSINEKCRGVIKGHLHENIIVDFPKINCKLITVGQLCNSNHHTNDNSGGNYAILREKGIEFKKL